jgi:predicted RND superfamily exporter protein/signal transduction histidine kinase
MKRLTRLALRRPLVACTVILLMTAGLASQIPNRGTETGYRAYLGAGHSTVARLDEFIDGFGGGLPIAAIWSCGETDACETVFDDSALEMAQAVVRALDTHSDVRHVDSPATTPVLIVTDDALGARSFVEDGLPGRDRDRMVELARRDPLWRGALISEDATVGAIVVELASSESDASRSVLRALEDALAPFEDQGFRYYILGQTAQFALTDESLAADSQRLMPIMIGLVAAVVFLLFRSWQTVLSALATVGLAAIWTMGAQGLLRWPENSITQTVPPLVLVISLCVSIHVLSRYSQRRLASGAVSAEEREAALVEAAGETGLACLATTVTTAVGFLAFAASGLESFVRFGVVSATGIVSALFLSFSILPILMYWFPADRVSAARASETWDHALSAMVVGTRVRARSILVGALLLGGLCVVGAWRLETDVDEYRLYGEESEVVKAFRFAEAHLRRPDSLEIELQLPEGRDFHDPATLNAIHGFASELSRIEGLGPVRSVLDALAWTNRLLNGDGPEFERLGRTAQENGALLTLLSLNDPSALDRWISPDFRRLRLSAEAEKIPTSQREPILRRVEDALLSELGLEWRATLTGSFAVYHDMTVDIQQTQLSSFGIAAIVVFFILMLFLRTLGASAAAAAGWAAAGMFSTVLPVVVTFGVMGFAGVNLDVGTAMVAAIIIGIGVDDTIHLLGEFCKRRERGMGASAAIEGAVLHVGQAVLTTSAALTAGFFALILSSWQSISSFGFLSGIAILGALAADLWILPASILAFSGSTGRQPERSASVSEKAPPQSRRLALSAAALLPVLCVLSVAGQGALDAPDGKVLACRVLPNGVVPIIAGSHPACSLRRFDRVIAVETEGGPIYASQREAFARAIEHAEEAVDLLVERGASSLRVRLPVTRIVARDRATHFLAALGITTILLTFALRAYWRSNAAAASALLLLFAAVSAEIISIVCLPQSDALAWVSAPVAPLIAATLTHLALTYPRERLIVRLAPRVVALPYAIAFVLAAVELRGLEREPSFWVLNVRFEMFLIAGAGLVLWLGALRAARGSRSPLERGRARLLLVGSGGIGVALAGMFFGWGEGIPGGHLAPLLAGVALFVVPLGFAVTRYDLFDLTARARRWLDRALRIGSVGLLGVVAVFGVQGVTGVSGPLLWGSGAMIAYAAGSVLHARLGGLVEHRLAPAVNRRRQLLVDHEQRAARLASQDMSARLVGRTLEAGIDTSGVAAFIREGEGWRPGYAGRENPAFRLQFAQAAARALGRQTVLHLARGDVPDCADAQLLREAGVELAVAMAAGREPEGLILVGRSRSGRAFTSEEIDFVRVSACHAGMAIHNARITGERIAAERKATLGRLVSGMAHDLGAALRVIERRAGRLIEHAESAGEVRREAKKLEEVSKYLINTVYDMVAGTEKDAAGVRAATTIEDVIEQAITAVGLPSGQGRVFVSVAPSVPRVKEAEKLVRILANLLQNALDASDESEVVWSYATAESGEIRIEIRDRGRGMAPEEIARAFDLFFTTRMDVGGNGIGLAISREIADDLGGKIELHSAKGLGTRAVVRIPAWSC